MYRIADCKALAGGGYAGALEKISDGEERRNILHAMELLTLIVNKHFICGPQLLTGRGYLRDDPSINSMSISASIVQRASEQIKKIKEAMDKEIREFVETGELSLGFKDMELYERVKMLEEQSKTQTAIIIALDDKVMNLEKEMTQHRDQILAIQYLLEVQMDQKNAEIEETKQAQEAEELKKEEYNKRVIEMYDSFLYFFFPSITLLVFAIIFTIYNYPENSLYIPENRTLIMDRSS
jgi:uncharacterized coiled-coil protein SlyX